MIFKDGFCEAKVTEKFCEIWIPRIQRVVPARKGIIAAGGRGLFL